MISPVGLYKFWYCELLCYDMVHRATGSRYNRLITFNIPTIHNRNCVFIYLLYSLMTINIEEINYANWPVEYSKSTF